MAYDLVVIGGGPSGEKAAAAAAFFGKKVALVEKAEAGPGGAAVHTGTLPSKTLRETALYLTGFKRRELYKGMAVAFESGSHSAPALMCRLPYVRSTQAEQIQQNLDRHGIELIKGEGKFEDPNHFRVGDRVIESKYFIISTGSRPRQPANFDFSDPEVYDSDSLLQIDRIPDSLAVIGGGVIGSEYACVFAALGVKIEVIEMRPRLLSFLDTEVALLLAASMQQTGIRLHLDNGVERLEREGDNLCLTLKDGQKMHVDKVLVCAGRTGNSDKLGIEEIGVALDKRKLIIVDKQFKTSVDNIFAAGDVIGRPALASTGMEQGRMAVAHMFGLQVPKRDWGAIPFGIYTIPEASLIGPTEQELQDEGTPYVVGRSEMKHNAREQIIGDTDGFVKLIFHRDDRRLLAAHMICERATELIHVPQAVMRLGGGIDYFLESIMTYPSLTLALKYAAYDAQGKLSESAEPLEPLH